MSEQPEEPLDVTCYGGFALPGMGISLPKTEEEEVEPDGSDSTGI
jgi:hypothetical protein